MYIILGLICLFIGASMVAYFGLHFAIPEWMIVLFQSLDLERTDSSKMPIIVGIAFVLVGLICIKFNKKFSEINEKDREESEKIRREQEEKERLQRDMSRMRSTITPTTESAPSLNDDFWKSLNPLESNGPEYLCDADGVGHRVVERRADGDIRLDNGEIIRATEPGASSYIGTGGNRYHE